MTIILERPDLLNDPERSTTPSPENKLRLTLLSRRVWPHRGPSVQHLSATFEFGDHLVKFGSEKLWMSTPGQARRYGLVEFRKMHFRSSSYFLAYLYMEGWHHLSATTCASVIDYRQRASSTVF